jgi:hypothetical protein
VAGNVSSRFAVRSSSRGKGTRGADETETMFVESSRSESLSESATCFPIEADDLRSSAPGGRVDMTVAKRRKRVTRDMDRRIWYLGGARAAIFARRWIFAPTPRTEAI